MLRTFRKWTIPLLAALGLLVPLAASADTPHRADLAVGLAAEIAALDFVVTPAHYRGHHRDGYRDYRWYRHYGWKHDRRDKWRYGKYDRRHHKWDGHGRKYDRHHGKRHDRYRDGRRDRDRRRYH